MCRGACFHANQARRHLCEECQQLWAIQQFVNHDLAVLIGPMNTKRMFARSMPTVVTLIVTSPAFGSRLRHLQCGSWEQGESISFVMFATQNGV